ncbi:hypothetical protein MCEMRE203_00336 [Candidatus Nanopelagicaceae bacterium]
MPLKFRRTLAKCTLASLALLTVTLVPTANAEPPINGGKEGVGNSPSMKDRLLPGCFGITDIPHLSKHVPGTVNVVAATICPGRKVFVTSTLVRITTFGSQSRTKTNQGIGRTTVSVSFKCSWKPGDRPIRYEVSSKYSESSGAKAGRVFTNELQC